MKYIFIFIFAVTSFSIIAQVKAVTEGGKEVLLFDNGTWKYVEGKKEEAPKIVELNVSEGLNTESYFKELYFAESKRLSKYFGPDKGKIRGKAKCIFVNGKPKLSFNWEVFLSDAYRYFGFMKSGKKLSLKTANNSTIELVLNEEVDIDIKEKYNFTVYKGSCTLNDKQFKALLNAKIIEIEVDWKKEPETYKLNDVNVFSNTFKELLINNFDKN